MSEDLLFHMSDVACVRAWDDEGWGPYHKRLLTMCIKLENSGWKRKTGMTQLNKILTHMRKTGSITQREAIIEYSIQSLTKRISELREMGYNIVSNVKYHPVTGQKYVRYTLVEARSQSRKKAA
jgi:hypothetical protein